MKTRRKQNGKRKTDIKFILKQIVDGNYQFFLEANEDLLKEISPYVLMMWLRINQDKNLPLFNIANQLCFHIQHNKLLLISLLIAVNSYRGRNFCWKRLNKDDDKELQAISKAYQCNIVVAKQYRQILSEEQISQLVNHYG